jgi:hypothetical protein
MDWESLWNVTHFYGIEKPRNRARRWWARHGQPRVRRGQARWTAWRQARQERRRMPTITEEALFKAATAQIAPDFLDWLKAQHYAAFLEDAAVQAQATERARTALEAEYAQRTEALEDAYAAKTRQV